MRDTLKVTLNGDPPFPVLFDPDSKVVLDQYGTKLFPETWIIDPKGVIRARLDGAKDWKSSLVMERSPPPSTAVDLRARTLYFPCR